MQKLDIPQPGLLLRRRRHAANTWKLKTLELRSVDSKIKLWILKCGSWAFPSHKTPSLHGIVLGAASGVLGSVWIDSGPSWAFLGYILSRLPKSQPKPEPSPKISETIHEKKPRGASRRLGSVLGYLERSPKIFRNTCQNLPKNLQKSSKTVPKSRPGAAVLGLLIPCAFRDPSPNHL